MNIIVLLLVFGLFVWLCVGLVKDVKFAIKQKNKNKRCDNGTGEEKEEK